MAQENILNIMVAQHALIEAMFFIFRDELKRGRKVGKRSLSELEWELKKHFFIEEKAIFDYLPFKDPEISEMIEQIKREHTNILDKISAMWKDFPNKKEFEIFYNKLKKHREFEEQQLYPVLDKRLTSDQKDVIIARVNEIPLNKR